MNGLMTFLDLKYEPLQKLLKKINELRKAKSRTQHNPQHLKKV